MIRIENIKIRDDLNNEQLIEFICKKNRINQADITEWRIYKKSIDARDKDDVHYNYSIDIKLKTDKKIKNAKYIEDIADDEFIASKSKYQNTVVIGAGPAGLFAALTLAQNGMNPIVIEQGKSVDERQKDVEEFAKKVNEEGIEYRQIRRRDRVCI